MNPQTALAQLDTAFRPLAEKFLAALDGAGIPVAITSARRTIADQNTLYAQGRGGKPGTIVTNAKGGQSPP